MIAFWCDDLSHMQIVGKRVPWCDFCRVFIDIIYLLVSILYLALSPKEIERNEDFLTSIQVCTGMYRSVRVSRLIWLDDCIGQIMIKPCSNDNKGKHQQTHKQKNVLKTLFKTKNSYRQSICSADT